MEWQSELKIKMEKEIRGKSTTEGKREKLFTVWCGATFAGGGRDDCSHELVFVLTDLCSCEARNKSEQQLFYNALRNYCQEAKERTFL